MNEVQRDRLTQETHQAVVGIPGTDDKGLVGDFKDMKDDIRRLNGKVRRNEVRSKVNQGIGTLLLSGVVWLAKYVGLW